MDLARCSSVFNFSQLVGIAKISTSCFDFEERCKGWSLSACSSRRFSQAYCLVSLVVFSICDDPQKNEVFLWRL